ncbi:hypothetical protein D1872_296700 [compost metagenome]
MLGEGQHGELQRANCLFALTYSCTGITRTAAAAGGRSAAINRPAMGEALTAIDIEASSSE